MPLIQRVWGLGLGLEEVPDTLRRRVIDWREERVGWMEERLLR